MKQLLGSVFIFLFLVAACGDVTVAPPLQNRKWTAITVSADGMRLAATEYAGKIHLSQDAGVSWSTVFPANNESVLWQAIASSADGVHLAAAVKDDPIWISTNSGVDWTRPTAFDSCLSITVSADGTRLAAVANPWDGVGGQIHTSTDSGKNWTPQYQIAEWVSITGSSDGTRLAALVYEGQIHTSVDAGTNWIARDSARDWQSIAGSSDGTRLAAVVFGGQVYTSVDAGTNWSERVVGTNREWWAIASPS